jgi:hypothetical protein
MNASYELGLEILSPELLAALRAQTPPDLLFNARGLPAGPARNAAGSDRARP